MDELLGGVDQEREISTSRVDILGKAEQSPGDEGVQSAVISESGAGRERKQCIGKGVQQR
jgi:hypothetical protein